MHHGRAWRGRQLLPLPPTALRRQGHGARRPDAARVRHSPRVDALHHRPAARGRQAVARGAAQRHRAAAGRDRGAAGAARRPAEEEAPAHDVGRRQLHVPHDAQLWPRHAARAQAPGRDAAREHAPAARLQAGHRQHRARQQDDHHRDGQARRHAAPAARRDRRRRTQQQRLARRGHASGEPCAGPRAVPGRGARRRAGLHGAGRQGGRDARSILLRRLSVARRRPRHRRDSALPVVRRDRSGLRPQRLYRVRRVRTRRLPRRVRLRRPSGRRPRRAGPLAVPRLRRHLIGARTDLPRARRVRAVRRDASVRHVRARGHRPGERTQHVRHRQLSLTQGRRAGGMGRRDLPRECAGQAAVPHRPRAPARLRVATRHQAPVGHVPRLVQGSPAQNPAPRRDRARVCVARRLAAHVHAHGRQEPDARTTRVHRRL